MEHDSEAMLTQRFLAAMSGDSRIDLRSCVLTITVHPNFVSLDGLVNDIRAKRVAANCVQDLLDEEFFIDDRVRIRTYSVSDRDLLEAATRALLEEPLFADCEIYAGTAAANVPMRELAQRQAGFIVVAVGDGDITLSGEVASLTQRRVAEALLWWIQGCRRVENLLAVMQVDADFDEGLTSAVTTALDRHPLVDTELTRIAVSAGLVELFDHVASDEQREFVEAVVWSVPDVWDVYNRIDVMSMHRRRGSSEGAGRQAGR